MLKSTIFRRVAEGEPVSAEQFNKLLAMVERMSGIVMSGGHMMDTPAGPVFLPEKDTDLHFVELTDIDGLPHDQSADDLHVDSSVASGSDPWVDFGTDSSFIMPPHTGVWLTGERSVLMRHSGAGKNILMPFTQWHFAKLDGDLFEGSTSTASIWEFGASGLQDADVDVTVHPWALPENESILLGSNIIIAQHRQSRRWYVIDWVREDVKEGVLDETLSAATAAQTGESTATMSVYTSDSSGVHDSGDNITVVQRFTEVGSVEAGTWMVVRRINGEWRPITTDCAATTL